MASTYSNSLRLELIATGEAAATWGDKTNVNLTNIASAFGYATQDGFAANADSTTTVADGVADPARAMYFKVTSSATLTATRTLTIAPNTISRVMWIENATTGGQSIQISQGTGANVTIATGKTAVVYLDGAGSGAAVVDAMAGVSSGASDTLAEILAAGNATGGTDIAVGTGDDITFADSSKAIFGAGSDLQIYHDGSNSWVSDQGTGQLILESGGAGVYIQKGATETMANFVADGSVSLYHDNSKKFETTATGIDVTGSVTADGVTVGDTSASQSLIQMLANPTNGANTIHFGDGTSADAYVGYINYAHDSNSMQFSANGAERLRIDSAGSTIIKSGNKLILNRTDNATGGEMSYVQGTGFIFNDANGDGVSFNQGVANKVRITSAGDVGIGTSSMGFNGQGLPLVVGSGTGNTGMTIFSGADSYGTLQFADAVTTGAASYAGVVSYNHTNNFMYFSTASTERMRIDSSGRLLIGKTVADSIGTDGIELDGANDRVLITRSDSEPLVLNRKTSDGGIAIFRKDGATVGSIGTNSGFPYIAAPANFSLMLATTDFRPRTVTGASDNDSAVDLGTSGSRFKDLYIGGDIGHKDASGNARLLYDKSVNLLGNAGTNVEAYNVTASNGIYLGGTAAANLLDDYEEGTWTPTLVGNTSGSATITVSSANYTKVGNKVFAACYIGTIDLSNDTIVGSMRIGGLPFSGASRYTQAVSIMYQTISTAYPNLSGYVQTNQIEINQNTTTTTLARSDCVSTSSRAIMIGVTYITSL